MVDLVSITGGEELELGPDPVVISDSQTGQAVADISSAPTQPEHVSRSSDTSEANSLIEDRATSEDAKKVCVIWAYSPVCHTEGGEHEIPHP